MNISGNFYAELLFSCELLKVLVIMDKLKLRYKSLMNRKSTLYWVPFILGHVKEGIALIFENISGQSCFYN